MKATVTWSVRGSRSMTGAVRLVARAAARSPKRACSAPRSLMPSSVQSTWRTAPVSVPVPVSTLPLIHLIQREWQFRGGMSLPPSLAVINKGIFHEINRSPEVIAHGLHQRDKSFLC